MILFKLKPTIILSPQFSGCGGDLKVLKSREKHVATLDIGSFRAKETIFHSGNFNRC
jgi:hypothetical protein